MERKKEGIGRLTAARMNCKYIFTPLPGSWRQNKIIPSIKEILDVSTKPVNSKLGVYFPQRRKFIN